MKLDDLIEDKENLIEDLTLLLLYLTATHEKDPATGEEKLSSWKSYDWNAMDKLVENGSLFPPKCRRTHARVLTPEGVSKAKQLLDELSFSKK